MTEKQWIVRSAGRCEEGKLVIVPRETVDDIDVFEEQQLSMVAERKVGY